MTLLEAAMEALDHMQAYGAHRKWCPQFSVAYEVCSCGGEDVAKHLREVIEAATQPKFPYTYCSQCGESFGPGNHGFSECESHKGMVAK